MTETDDFVTGAIRLGAVAFDTWLGIYKGVASAVAEVINPDDFVLGDNAVALDVYPRVAGPLCVGWFTTTPLPPPTSPPSPLPLEPPAAGVTDVLSPEMFSLSPAGLSTPVPSPTDPKRPLPQKVRLWIKDPGALPDTVENGNHHGALYVATDAKRPVARVTISVAKDMPSPFGHL